MNAEDFKISVMPIKDKMFRLAKRMLFNTEEAEDAVQDVLMKLWLLRNRMTNTKNPQAYAMMSTRNYCVDKIRTRKKMVELNENMIETKILQADKKVELLESKQIIERIIKGLPEKQRIIIHLRDIEQYDYKDIEQITGFNRNYIKVNLSRARKKVRTIIS